MKIIGDLAAAVLRRETILTIGSFDGVHLGHQALIGQVVARAHATGRMAAVVTFHPHPAVVLAPDRAPRYLTTPREKAAQLEGLNVDLLAQLPFNRQVSATPARDFVGRLSRHLRMRELWVGADFALGRNREGDVPSLQGFGRELGYGVQMIQPVVDSSGNGVISSSRIRALLSEGRVKDAAGMLGRYARVSGDVVVGARRGHALGFPTANLEIRSDRSVPADGVYAAFALLDSRRLPAVASVGLRPSFGDRQRIVETHILDFDWDIYGCDLKVEFVDRLRDEQQFAGSGALAQQIGRDRAAARAALSGQTGVRHSNRPDDRARGGETSYLCPHRYKEVEHTADRAIRVWGRGLPDLFIGAARGMYHLMADQDGLVATEWREILLDASDQGALLVEWLNELLYLSEVEGLIFVDFQIESLTGASLAARVGGVPSEPAKALIKAATFHDLVIVREGTGWSSVVTFDV